MHTQTHTHAPQAAHRLSNRPLSLPSSSRFPECISARSCQMALYFQLSQRALPGLPTRTPWQHRSHTHTHTLLYLHITAQLRFYAQTYTNWVLRLYIFFGTHTHTHTFAYIHKHTLINTFFPNAHTSAPSASAHFKISPRFQHSHHLFYLSLTHSQAHKTALCVTNVPRQSLCWTHSVTVTSPSATCCSAKSLIAAGRPADQSCKY